MADSATWVINASPLILLSRIGQLAWLEQLAETLWVPNKVIEETSSGQDFDPFAMIAVEWAMRRRIADIAVPTSVRAWDIDPGESQVIAHALRLGCRAVLDDAAARRCAQALGLPVVGSIGVVLRAKTAGVIAEARPWLEKLQKAGMFADDHLIEAALASVGE
jgi:predicted nucleic acid-binding protein